jgi:Tol biopolymer transport system component
MASDDPRLEEVASAILDGTPVDWTVGSGADGSSVPLIQQFKIVAAVADVHRSAAADTELNRSWGSLRLLERIGGGSFGEVYRAWDSRLDREVALKLLPMDAAPDDAASSVIHEGRLLARIHHPNVVTIYGAERIDGRIGLWMEFIHGHTLAQLLDGGRVFTPREVAAMGAELCDALTAVHGAGLLHRDIKAANVMIADDGRVVLMDFGTGTDITDGSSDDLAGTPLYLAPELLAGREPSARSDIYSVGVLLYHLLTRSYPVTADSLPALREAHARRQTPAARISRRELPGKLARILHRALDPRPERRDASAASLRADLLSISSRRRTRPLILSAALLMAAAVPGWFFSGGMRSRNAGPATLTEPVVAPRLTQMHRLTQTGDAVSAALSPDGSFVVIEVERGGRSSLWLRRLADGSTMEIAGPAPVRYWQPTVGPDGRSLYFLRSNRDESGASLFRLEIAAGARAQLLYHARDLQGGLALSRDGTQVALLQTSQPRDESIVVVIDTKDGTHRTLGRRNFASAVWQLAWSPDGRTLAGAAGTADGSTRDMHVVALNVEDGSERVVTAHPWAFIGRLDWIADGSGLLMVATDALPRTDQIWFLSYPSGLARRITDDADRYRGLSVNTSVSALVTAQVRARRTIWTVPVAPAPNAASGPAIDATSAREIFSGSGRLSWTPQGEIVFASTASGTSNIWRAAADGTRPRQLTRVGVNTDPAVSPDGRTIVFESNRGDGVHLWRMDDAGRNAVQLTTGTGEAEARFTADGAWLIYNSLADRSLWKVPTRGGAPVQLADRYASWPTVSPDGRWIAYNIDDGGPARQRKIAVMSADGGLPKKVFIRPRAGMRTFELHWSPDGSAITYERTDDGVSNIWSQPLTGGSPRRLTDFKSDYIFAFAWSPDGTRLAVLRGAYETDVLLYSITR